MPWLACTSSLLCVFGRLVRRDSSSVSSLSNLQYVAREELDPWFGLVHDWSGVILQKNSRPVGLHQSVLSYTYFGQLNDLLLHVGVSLTICYLPAQDETPSRLPNAMHWELVSFSVDGTELWYGSSDFGIPPYYSCLLKCWQLLQTWIIEPN